MSLDLERILNQNTLGYNQAASDRNFTKIKNEVDADEELINSLDANKANKTWGNPIAVALQNGWTGELFYSKNDLNEIWLRGAPISGVITGGTIISTLPTGYYSNASETILNVFSAGKYIHLNITTSGEIIIRDGLNFANGVYAHINHVYKV